MGTLPALTGGSPILLNEILVEGLFPQIRKKPQINRVVALKNRFLLFRRSWTCAVVQEKKEFPTKNSESEFHNDEFQRI